jgi:hypothetical protein
MLKLDQFSESVLFQCDRCRHVGMLFTDLIEEEGYFFCWRCLDEVNHPQGKGEKKEKYAIG